MRFLTTKLAAMLRFKRRPRCLTGPASVIDGDTIVVAGEFVRLHGIDAPELDQTFWWRGRHIFCGTMALAALEALTAGTKVRCEAIERDRHGRLVAKCFSPDGVDIGRRLVSAGWALAYRRYSTDYLDAEEEARKGTARDVAGSFRETLGVARILTGPARADIFLGRSFVQWVEEGIIPGDELHAPLWRLAPSRGSRSRKLATPIDCSASGQHFLEHLVVLHDVLEIVEGRDGAGLDHGLVDCRAGKSPDRRHGLPAREHQKLDLVALCTPAKLGAEKSGHRAQLRDDHRAKVLGIGV
jgi:Staphylococcal nuclease homologue